MTIDMISKRERDGKKTGHFLMYMNIFLVIQRPWSETKSAVCVRAQGVFTDILLVNSKTFPNTCDHYFLSLKWLYLVALQDM